MTKPSIGTLHAAAVAVEAIVSIAAEAAVDGAAILEAIFA
jgi:hypothetical protein